MVTKFAIHSLLLISNIKKGKEKSSIVGIRKVSLCMHFLKSGLRVSAEQRTAAQIADGSLARGEQDVRLSRSKALGFGFASLWKPEGVYSG